MSPSNNHGETRLELLQTTDHIFVSLPLHPISFLPVSLLAAAPPRLKPYAAPSFTQPRLDLLLASTSSSLPLDLAMPHLPTHLTSSGKPSFHHSLTQSPAAMCYAGQHCMCFPFHLHMYRRDENSDTSPTDSEHSIERHMNESNSSAHIIGQ